MNIFQDFLYEEVQTTSDVPATITITNYQGNEKHLTIPSCINGSPVTILSHSIFADQSQIESVILPNTLEKIQDYTFSYCEKLQSIQFPSSLRNIGTGAFQHCSSLQELVFPEGFNSFNNKCFSHCTSLKRIYFPKSLVGMGEHAFTNCTNLEEVTTHPDFVFRDRNHFSNCKKLWNHQGLVVINEKYLGVYGSFNELVIPEGILELPPLLCSKLSTLERVSLPSTLEVIGGGAFQDCGALSHVDLPKSLKKLPFNCFQNCISLKNIVLPRDLEEIESSCFRGCTALEEVSWNDRIHTIGEHAFHKTGISTLPHLSFLEEIHRGAFSSCNNLSEVYFSPALHTLGDAAFHLSLSLQTICFSHSQEDLRKMIANRKNIFSYNQNLKKAPEPVVETWADSHQVSFRINQFLHWEELDLEHQDFFYKNWSGNTEGNKLVDLIFLEGVASEMALYLQLGFTLTLYQVDDYLEHQILLENTAEIAILLEYKKRHFTTDQLEAFETDKDLVDMGFQMPTLEQLKRKWNVFVENNCIFLKNYIGNKEIACLPDATMEGIPLFYPKYFILKIMKSQGNLSPLTRIIFSTGEEIDLVNHSSTIKVLEFPPDMPFIDRYFCENMDCLETVILPDGLTHLHHSTFENCPNLKTVLFQNLPENIASNAFYACPSLEFFGTEDGENFLHTLL